MSTSFPAAGLACSIAVLVVTLGGPAVAADGACDEELSGDNPAAWGTCTVHQLEELNTDAARLTAEMERSSAVLPALSEELLSSLNQLASDLEEIQAAIDAMMTWAKQGDLSASRANARSALAGIDAASTRLKEMEALIGDHRPWFPEGVQGWQVVREGDPGATPPNAQLSTGEQPPATSVEPPPSVKVGPEASWQGDLVAAESPPGDLARLLPLIEIHCPGLPAAELSGPWEHEGDRYYSALLSRSDEGWPGVYDIQDPDSSCLLVARQGGDELVTLGSTAVVAGYSLRHQEFQPPALLTPLMVPGWPACARTSATTEGHGGGGGPQMETYCPTEEAGLKRVLTATLESYTDINTASEQAANCRPIDLIPDVDGDEIWLVARGCFDGEPQDMMWRFEGGTFVQMK